MSTTIDNRVVEMQFDNRQFEQNIHTSIRSLDKLDQSLNLTGASNGLQNVGNAAKGINLGPLTTAAETVGLKFNAMYTIADQALRNITNSAMITGKRIVSALTIDPIKTGFSEYETQINAVQTILANTESKGTTLEDVNSALDTLNEYADKTIYNFTEMTRNIGTFTAAGVDLDTSVKSIQGIANLAAVSGSTSQQASTAMYQLSQALAAGKVNLMDWNSVVNAGMGGQVFQDALKRTAKNMGKDVDGMIKKYGSFRESLSKGDWLTTEVLTKTLEQFTMAADEGTEEWEAYKKSLMDEGYTAKQAEEILKMANTATDAATKVKTFTQLWDTLKEAAQSGWTQTWEIIVGDFEEAKELLTNISNVIGDLINKSAKSRNDLLQGWKDLGGRKDLIEGFENIFEGIGNIAAPIAEAFREIFPALKPEQLHGFTEGFKELTAGFESMTEKIGPDVKRTFEGIFAVVDIFLEALKTVGGGAATIIKSLSGIEGGIFGVTGAIGDWLKNLRDSIKEGELFGNTVGAIADFISDIIIHLKNFTTSTSEAFNSDSYEGFVGILKSIWEFIKNIGSTAVEAFSSLTNGIANAFGESSLLNVVNTGLFGGILAGIGKFIWGLGDTLGETGGFLENITGILDDVRDCLSAYQDQLKAGTLQKIAISIGILAASLWLISTIDAESLGNALIGISFLFAELMASLTFLSKATPNITGVTKVIGVMIGVSVAVLILSSALKTLSSVNPERMLSSLFAVGTLMGELGIFLNTVKLDGKIMKSATGIVILSSAMLILAKAVEDFGAMSLDTLMKGIGSIGAILIISGKFQSYAGKAQNLISTGVSIVLLAGAMKIMASAFKDFGTIEWDNIGRGLTSMGLALAEIVAAMYYLPTDTFSKAAGLIVAGAALKVLANALYDFGSLSIGQAATGLITLGLALAALAVALNKMNGSVSGAGALIISAGALAIIAPVLKTLGDLSWIQIVKGLGSLAGAFAVIGIAGYLLGPMVPTILGLAAAFALFGVATATIGVGLAAVAAGFTMLAAAGTAGATAIVAALTVIITGIAELIPIIAEKFGEAIVAFAAVIGECAPALADAALKLITSVLESLAEYAPRIVDSLLVFLIEILNSLADHMPELIVAAMRVIGAFFQGLADALGQVDSTTIFQGILAVGLLSGLMVVLSSIVGFIPGALAGVLGIGAVIAELALVLAAIGALAQIPGLEWLISEGGDFLQKVGTAIGQFVGGIAGGIMEGVTSSFPQIGTDLSSFMTNAQPFIEGAKSIDSTMLEGVKTLVEVITLLSGASILDSISSWITGGNSLTDFANQLVPFGKSMKEYADAVAGIDQQAVTNSAIAAEALVEVANNIPNSGGLASFFSGDNDISSFATKLVPFGKSMKEYADAVAGIDADSVVASATAAKSISNLANNLPNSGGLVSFFSGDNDISSFATKLVPFGKSIKAYSDSVVGISLSAVSSSITAARSLMSLISGMSSIDYNGVDLFRTALVKLANVSIDNFVQSFNISLVKVKNLGANITESIANGALSKQPTLTTNANKLISVMLDNIKMNLNKFKLVGAEIIEAFNNGVKSNTNKVQRSILAMISDSVTSIRTYYINFYSVGSYLVDGFASGISDNQYKASAKARAMAKAAAKAAEEELDINSPSKVFRDIGTSVPEGFAMGIDKLSNAVGSSTVSMANTALDGVRDSISRISNIIDSDMNVQPTIRPVLDLDNLRSGVGTINGMFGFRPSLGVMTNLDAISYSMRNQNGTNDDVVYAIDKLRRDLGNIGGNSYNINGLNYSDDTAVGEAIEALVRAIRIEGRV